MPKSFAIVLVGDRFFLMEFTSKTITNHVIPLVQLSLVAQLRELVAGFTASQKIGATQMLLYQASKQIGTQYIVLVPKKGFDEGIKKVFAIAEFLPVETLLDLATEILVEPRDKNE